MPARHARPESQVVFFVDGYKFTAEPVDELDGVRWLLWCGGFMWGGFRGLDEAHDYVPTIIYQLEPTG